MDLWRGYLERLLADDRLLQARDKWRRLELTAGGQGMVEGPLEVADVLAGSTRTVMTGAAGCGKTLLLQAVLHDYAQYALAADAPHAVPCPLCEEQRIPLYLDLEEATDLLTPEIALQSWLSLFFPEEASAMAAAVVSNPTAHLCLIDHPEALSVEGFTRFIQAFFQGHPRIALVVAMRDHDQPLWDEVMAGFQQIRINALTAEQVFLYCIGRGNEACFQAVVPRIVTDHWRGIFTNLRALEVWEEASTGAPAKPLSPLDMLNAFFSRLSPLLSEEIRYSLGELALALKRNRGQALPHQNVCALLVRTSSPPAGEEQLQRLVRAGLLKLTSGRKGVDFLSPALADYFAALGLRTALRDGRPLASLLPGELDLWEETVGFLYGFGSHKETILTHLLSPGALTRQVRLAVHCVTLWEPAEQVVTVLHRHCPVPGLYRFVAKALAELGHLEPAQQEYQEALRLQPGRPDLLTELAHVQVGLGQHRLAASTLQQVGSLTASDLRWRIDVALALEGMGDDAGAWNQLLETRGTLTGNLAETCYQLSLLALKQGRVKEAAAQAQQAAQLLPGARFLSHLGRLLYETGEKETAREALERAVLVDMHSAQAHRALGWFWEQENSPRRALDHYQLAAAAEPLVAQHSFHLGRLLHASGQSRRAELYLKRAATLDPNWAASWAELGLLCQEEGRWEDARRYVQRALDLEPLNAAHHHQQGWLLRSLGDDVAAEQAMREAVKLSPENAEYHNRLGVLLLERRRPALALAEYQEAVRLAPGNLLYQRNLGEVLLQVGQQAGALEAFQKALSLWETQQSSGGSLLSTLVAADVHQRLGQIWEGEGHHQAAARAYHTAAELVPHQVEYRLREGLAYGYLHQHHHMLEVLRRAAQMQPQDPIVHFQLGQAYESMGWLSEALGEYQEAVRLDPQGAPFLKGLGRMQRRLGKIEASQATLERAVAADASDADAHFQFGISLEQDGLWDRALAAYRAAAQLEVERAEYWLAVGRARRVLHSWSEAQVALRTALTLEPTLWQARLELAQLLAAQGRYAEALEECRWVLRREPGAAQAHFLAGRFSRALGHLPEARRLLEEAVRLEPGVAEYHVEVGAVLEQLGEPVMALNEQQAAVALAPQWVEPWARSSRLVAGLGRLDEAVAWLERALALSPDEIALHLAMAHLKLRLGAWNDVLRHAERILALDSQHQEALLLNASAQLELGQFAQAATLLQALQPESSSEPHLWALWGRVLEGRQEWDKAKEAYDKAITLGTDASLRPRLAAVHARLGEYVEAAKELERALAEVASVQAQERGGWHLALADIYRVLGRKEEARAQYQAAATAGREAAAHLGLGHLCLDEGQFEAALRDLEPAGTRGLNDPRWHHALALAHQGLGNLAAALAAAKEAVALSSQDAELWHHLATLCQQQGDLPSAEQALREAIRWNPLHSASWIALGVVLQSQGKPQDALQAYERAMALAPQEVSLRGHLGRLLLHVGQASEAVAVLEPAAQETNSSETILLYGQALEEAGRWAEALAAYERFLSVEPNSAEVLFRLGRTLGQLNQVAQGTARLEQALALAPDSAGWWQELGRLYETMGRRREAVEAYQRVEGLLDLETHLRLGRLLLWLGQATEAVSWIQRALATHGEGAQLRLGLGDAYLAMGKADAALREFRRATKLAPRDAAIQIKEAEALLVKEELVLAERLLEQIRTVEPHSTQAWLLWGRLRQRQGRWSEAQAAMEEAVHLAPTEGRFRYALAQLLSSQGGPEEAQAQLREALQDQSLAPQALVDVGRLYELLGRYDQALTAYQRVVAEAPSAQGYGDMARVQRRLGMAEAAMQSLSQAIALEPHHASWHRELGELLEEKGDLAAALEAYQRALILEPTSAQMHYAVASVLDQQGRYAAALQELEASLRLHPHWQQARRRLEAVSAKLTLERGGKKRDHS